MDESPVTCFAMDDGAECLQEALIVQPVPLCAQHGMQIALLVVPEVLASSMRSAKTGVTPQRLGAVEREALISGARPVAVKPYSRGSHRPVVYFVENGENVKIGYTTHLRGRIMALALKERNVMLLLDGGPTLERALHASYASDRIDGTEWFDLSGRLTQLITSKRAQLALNSEPVEDLEEEEDGVDLDAPAPGVIPRAVRAAAPKYPDGLTIEIRHRELWHLLGMYGADGAFAVDLALKQLDGFTSESNVRKQLRIWRSRGFVDAVKDGRAERFWRLDVIHVDDEA